MRGVCGMRLRPCLRERACAAFVACGGNADKSGHVHRDTLIKIIKHDFGLTVDIEKLIEVRARQPRGRSAASLTRYARRCV